MEYHDKVLKCAECGAEFVFTAGEQMFFADKGFKNEPKRCKACKATRAQGSGFGLGNSFSGSKPRPFARSAARKPPFRSSQRKGVPYIAANVFSSGEPWEPRRAHRRSSRSYVRGQRRTRQSPRRGGAGRVGTRGVRDSFAQHNPKKCDFVAVAFSP